MLLISPLINYFSYVMGIISGITLVIILSIIDILCQTCIVGWSDIFVSGFNKHGDAKVASVSN